jgi:hypothetical protein
MSFRPPEPATDRIKDTRRQTTIDAVNAFLPGVLMGPDDFFQAPQWLHDTIVEVATETASTPNRPPARFDTTPEGLEHNSKLLAEYGYDFDKFLGAHQVTSLGFGSEFRTVRQLEKVLGPHQNFPFFKGVLERGMSYLFKTQISEEQRKAELRANVNRGNQKSAELDANKVLKLLKKDVHHGLSVPVLPSLVFKLKRALGAALLRHCPTVRPHGFRRTITQREADAEPLLLPDQEEHFRQRPSGHGPVF